MSIRTQLNLSMLLFLLVLAVIIASTIIYESRSDRMQEQLDIIREIERGARYLSSLTNDYLLNPVEGPYQRWETVYGQIDGYIVELGNAGIADTEKIDIIQGVHVSLGETFQETATILINTSPSEDPGYYLETIRFSWAQIETQNRSLVEEVSLLWADLRERQNAMEVQFAITLYVALGLFVLFLAGTYFFSYRRALGSLDTIRLSFEIVGAGNLDHRITVHTRDEIGQLGRAFNTMTGNLQEVTGSKAELEREAAERQKAEEALRISEEKYRNLFSTMSEASVLHELIYDEKGEPVDYRFLEANDAFLKRIGLTRDQVIGHLRLDVIPDNESWRLKVYDRVARTGIPETMQVYSSHLEKYFRLYIYSPGKNQFATLSEDIAQSLKAEEALRQSEERFRIMADSSPTMIWVTGPQGELQFANKAYCDFYNIDFENIFTPGWQPTLHPEDAERHVNAFFEAVRKQTDFHSEARTLRADGEYRWLETFGAVRFSPEGDYLGMVGSSPDTTDRKRVEEALEESRESMERAQEIAHLGSWELDRMNDRLTWSDETYRIFGFEPQEFTVTYKDFLNIVHPEDRPEVERTYLESVDKGRDSYEIEHRIVKAHTGETRYIHEKAQHLYDETGKCIRSVGMVHDITDSRKAQELLRWNEETLRTIFESTALGLIMTDMQGNLIRINHTLEDLLEYSSDEIRERGLPLVTHPDDRDITHRMISSLVGGERGSYRLEKRYVKKDGTFIWVDVSTTLLRDENGQPSRLVTSVMDITERKRTDQMKDEFIGMVSHEIKTPLTVVIGALSTAVAEGLPQEQVREFLHDAMVYADVLTDIVDNLLELSRSQSNRLILNKEAADIRTIAVGVVHALKDKSAGHEVIIEIPPDLPRPVIDPFRVDRIIHNLVDNAIKYSPSGGRIQITARQEASHLLIGVSDEGIGISAEDQAKLFQRFQRLGYDAGTSIQGIGLGLNVCRILVEAHGGRIWIESEKGKGSTFYFTIPL